ncbi:MAG TPA: hypothetical protein PL042_01665 [Caldisericia bacterium]|nr:hypothetical protein [Caldisericia bacterium]
MGFKEVILSLLGVDLEEYNEEIKDLEEKLSESESEIKELKNTIESKSKTITTLMSQKTELTSLNKDLDSHIELLQNRLTFLSEQLGDFTEDSEETRLEEYYNNKYPDSTIKYIARSFPFSTTEVAVPLNVLITPNDPDIIAYLKSWKLYQTGEDPETLVPKIYNKVYKLFYKYLYDEQVWNSDEVFEFPFEMINLIKKGLENNKKQGFDCDSWSILLESFYIASGVPRWRCRVVAGLCKLGGHSTNEIFSMKDKKWHHLNSTYGFTIYDNLSDYPTHEDIWSPTNTSGKDTLGIYSYYFSYNDKYIWRKADLELPTGYTY